MWKFHLAKKNTKTIGILTLLLLITGIGVTVLLSQEEQNTRQDAQEACMESSAADLFIVFDASSSMDKPATSGDSSTKLERAKAATKSFVNLLSQKNPTPHHLLGLITFSSQEATSVPITLTKDPNRVSNAIDNITLNADTCIQCAVRKLSEEFDKPQNRSNVKNVAILLSDGGATTYIGDPGDHNQNKSMQKAMEEILSEHEKHNTIYYTIGFGTDAGLKPEWLKEVATKTGGKYYFAPSGTDLQEALTEISSDIAKGSISGMKYYDEDEDGKYDTEEEKLSDWTINLKDSTGKIIDTRTTDTQGNYTFENVCIGTYKVEETLKEGWKKVTPQTEHTVSIENGSALTAINFGNVYKGIPPTPTATPIPPPPVCPENATLDAMIIFDKSGSMSDPTSATDKTPRMTRAKEAAVSFVDLLANDTKSEGKHHVGLSAFAAESTTKLDSPLTEDAVSVKKAINAMPIEAQTCAECGIKIANEELRAHKRGGNVKAIAILITDGVATRYISAEPPFDTNTQIQARKRALDEIKKGYTEQKITYYTIGFGNEVDKTFLEEVAKTTGGKYIQIPSAAQLEIAFKQIADIAGISTISGYKFLDENNNGKYDTEEEKLPGWDIILKNSDTNTEVTATITDQTGNYTFEKVCIGNYTVSEIQKQGYIKTFPTTTSHALKVTKGQIFPNINFGNREAPTPNTLKLNILLDGIGTAGDTQNPNENQFSNKEPHHKTRDVSIEILNDLNKTIATTKGEVTYDNESGAFIGDANLNIDFSPGLYFVRLKIPHLLSKKLKDKVQIKRTENNLIPKQSLITGDTNSDNKLNMLDYNEILSCYTGLRGKPEKCSDTLYLNADINDDGIVNEVDYNLFIRELPAIAGS